MYRIPVAHPLRDNSPSSTHANPLITYDDRLIWARHAQSLGVDFAQRVAFVEGIDHALIALGERPFRVTPCARADDLSSALGFEIDGGIWLKDETNNVSGSHKARHLISTALLLLAQERSGVRRRDRRSPLAIASCGNAALAAAVLAHAVDWPLHVFMPEWASSAVTSAVANHSATVVRCPRLDSDPPGDPCIFRFREAVTRGAIPFSVQGTDNAYCNDAGRTLAWEVADSGVSFDAVFVQVGGGALATSLAHGLADAMPVVPRFYAVQALGCAPFIAAYHEATQRNFIDLGRHWDRVMQPWPNEPTSVATGILDDETYDWLGFIDAVNSTGGTAVTATEDHIGEAYDLVWRHTTIAADHTGTAALAGLLAHRSALGNHERILVPITGRQRSKVD